MFAAGALLYRQGKRNEAAGVA
ncbi:MAG: hypothetical protein RL091_1931, partial [Verrucomicrobiota bacterium]